MKLPGKHLLATFVLKFCSKTPIFSWNWKVSFLLTLRDSTYLFSCWIGLTFPPISIENEAILMTLCMAFGVCLRPHSRFFTTTTRPLLYIFSCCEEEVKTRYFPIFPTKAIAGRPYDFYRFCTHWIFRRRGTCSSSCFTKFLVLQFPRLSSNTLFSSRPTCISKRSWTTTFFTF